MNQLYECEYCGETFDDYEECEMHEDYCDSNPYKKERKGLEGMSEREMVKLHFDELEKLERWKKTFGADGKKKLFGIPIEIDTDPSAEKYTLIKERESK